MMNRQVLVVIGLLASCRGMDDASTVEPNTLGISYLEIQRTHTTDSVLEIRGFDASGAEIARATLRTGDVTYTPEPELLAPGVSLGTELNIAVDTQTYKLITPDLTPQELVEPSQPSVAAFTRLAGVASQLETEAGIRFLARPTAAETPYFWQATSCNGNNFPTNKGNPYSCCQEGTGGTQYTWHTFGDDWLGHRAIGAAACRTASGGTNCSGSACAFGPCRGRVLTDVDQGFGAHVYHAGGDLQCGYDNGVGAYSPDPYDGSQSLWNSLAATCTCTGCTNGVATPAGCQN